MVFEAVELGVVADEDDVDEEILFLGGLPLPEW